jgi:hypothetical protein
MDSDARSKQLTLAGLVQLYSHSTGEWQLHAATVVSEPAQC